MPKKYTKQDMIEEESANIFAGSLRHDLFLVNDFGAKDKYPDIDGQIRLRDGNGTYLNKYLHYQLKGVSKMNMHQFSCKKEILQYLEDTNVPTILFIVDVSSKNVYWYFIDGFGRNALKKKKPASETLKLEDKMINEPSLDQRELQFTWMKLAKEDDYLKQKDALSKIVNDFKVSVGNAVGLVYLLQAVEKTKAVIFLKESINTPEDEAKLILRKLVEDGILTETDRLYVIGNSQIGIDSLFNLLGTHKLPELLIPFNSSQQATICKQLIKIKHPESEKYFKNFVKELLKQIGKLNNDKVFESLNILSEFCHKYPSEGIAVSKKIINLRTPIKPIEIYPEIWGKAHEDLVLKAISILSIVKYYDIKESLSIFFSLANSTVTEVAAKATDQIKAMANYNYYVLRKFGYGPQHEIINTLSIYPMAFLVKNMNSVIVIGKEILSSSFEGTEWQGNKITIRNGSLTSTKVLQKIREDIISLLQNIYSVCKDANDKISIIKTLERAFEMPREEKNIQLIKTIFNDSIKILDFFKRISEAETDNEVLKCIDESVVRVVKRNKAVDKKAHLVISVLEKMKDYQIYKHLVGYDRSFALDMGWEKVENARKEMVSSLVSQISEKNLSEWEAKIRDLLKNYSEENIGEYSHFFRFLFLLGQEKTELAEKLLRNEKIAIVDVHLLAGILTSVRKQGIKIIEEWLEKSVNIRKCVEAMGYIREPAFIDIKLLTKGLEKASIIKDELAISRIVSIAYFNSSSHKSLRKLFFDAVMSLSKIKSTAWVNWVWYIDSPILEKLSSREEEIILTNLLQSPNIDYHYEKILVPIALKAPVKVINWFFKRIKIQLLKRKTKSYYDAIPHSLQLLNKPLTNPRVFKEILKWFTKGGNEDNWLFRFEASHVIANIHSKNLDQSYMIILQQLIEKGNMKEVKIVLSIFDSFEGGNSIWGICKSIIKKYSRNKDYIKVKNRLYNSLSKMGVTMGKDGRKDGYEAKKAESYTWDDESNPDIREFILGFQNYCEIYIQHEDKQIAEDDILEQLFEN